MATFGHLEPLSFLFWIKLNWSVTHHQSMCFHGVNFSKQTNIWNIHLKMSLFTLFEIPITFKYKSKLFSQGFLFDLICIAFNIIIPLVIVYSSDGLWKKLSTFNEQPNVNFKHNLMMILQTKNNFLFWSTFPSINRAVSYEQLRIPYIKVIFV